MIAVRDDADAPFWPCHVTSRRLDLHHIFEEAFTYDGRYFYML